MKLETLSGFSRSKFALSTAQPDLSGVALANAVSRTASKIAAEATAEWQQVEVKKASAAGAVAGTQPNVTYQSGDTLTAQAFNKAAVQATTARVNFDTSYGMTSLRETHANDPIAYKTASDNFISETVLGLKENGQTAQLATKTANELKLQQQSDSYKIDKVYMANQVSQIKADTAVALLDIKASAYVNAGGVFSPDVTEMGIALNQFNLNRTKYEAQLKTVTPDGKAVYTPEAVQKRLQAYHAGFYTTAVQSWVSEADLTVEDLVKIKEGTLTIDIPGAEGINILNEVGQDAYESKVVKFTTQKMRDKIATERKEETLIKEGFKEQRDFNDAALISSIYDEDAAISTTSVLKQLKKGLISKSTANAAIKMMHETVIEDDALYATLKIQQVQGNLDIAKIPQYAAELSPDSFRKLMEAGVKQDKTMQSEDEKWIVREMVKKDRFGMDDPKSVRLASDMVDYYRQQIKDGVSTDLAVEKVRANIDVLKDRANREIFNSVPKYSVIENNTINPIATAQATMQAFKRGKITEEVYDIEMDRLNALMNEKRGGRSE